MAHITKDITLRKADAIYVLIVGKNVESGTHEELMEMHGAYFELSESEGEDQCQIYVNTCRHVGNGEWNDQSLMRNVPFRLPVLLGSGSAAVCDLV